MKEDHTFKIRKSDEEWRQLLTPEQYRILREAGTERAFTGPFLNNKHDGTYSCLACGNVLFTSETKFDSGSGWPSFYDLAKNDAVTLREDHSHSMTRIEALCADCGSHLGHVFNDGPQPTGLRYCINGNALKFEDQ